MVGRSFPGSGFPVDVARAATLRHRRTREYQVDPQTGIPLETGAPVIPPAETLLRLLELAEDIAKPEVQKRL